MRYPVNVTKDTNGTVLVSFVDLPAHSVGEDEDEALLSAIDALETAVAGCMARRVEVPEPGVPKRGQRLVEVSAQTAAKIDLWNAMLAAGLRKSDLARRLSWHMPQVDRLFDVRHGSRFEAMEQAARAIGKRLEIRLA